MIVAPPPGISSEQPVCSVCIANYNGVDVIGLCLDSVLSQDFDHAVEIIVHDDASTDESTSYIRRCFPQVQLLTSDDNVGFCVSNNRMVAKARGRFILLLNNDATLFPDALRVLHEHAMLQKKPGIVGLPQYDMQTGDLIDIGSCLDVFLNPVPNRDPNRHQVGMVTGACLWLPKVLWDELGGFPPFFGSLAEDLYLCCMARAKGYSVSVSPTSGFRHWVGMSLGGGRVIENALRTSYSRRALSERNRLFVLLLVFPIPWILFFAPLHLMVLTLEGISATLLARNRRLWKEVYARCLKEFFAYLGTIRRYRSQHPYSLSLMARSVSGLTPKYHKLSMVLKHGLPIVE